MAEQALAAAEVEVAQKFLLAAPVEFLEQAVAARMQYLVMADWASS
jgi:hypothetical protein